MRGCLIIGAALALAITPVMAGGKGGGGGAIARAGLGRAAHPDRGRSHRQRDASRLQSEPIRSGHVVPARQMNAPVVALRPTRSAPAAIRAISGVTA